MNTLILAHRGDTSTALENTLEAVQAAIKNGADGFEVDVQISADGVPFIFHDETLARLASRSLGEGWSKKASKLMWSKLQEVRLNGGYRIPSLKELLDQCGGRTFINLELKTPLYCDNQGRRAFFDLIKKQDPAKLLISSFHPWPLWVTRRAVPSLKTALLFYKPLNFLKKTLAQSVLRVSAYNPALSIVSEDWTRPLREQGKGIFVWTVNEEGAMRRLFDMGVNGIFTDRLDLALRVRDQWAHKA